MKGVSAILVTSSANQLRLLVMATRPRQWTKNLLIYLAFFFTLGEHDAHGFGDELSLFLTATYGVLLFSLLTGATYIMNDLADLKEDQLHERKRNRPLASGQLSPGVAVPSALALAGAGIALSFFLDVNFGIVSVVYLSLMTAYTFSLKHMVILDVLSISAGFVLRAAAGALVIDAPISPWLYLMTSLGALMLALGKRRNELDLLGEDGAAHRPALKDYTKDFVDQLMGVVAPAAVVSYTLYTFTAENLPHNNAMMLTIPFVLYGIFRYLFLVHRRNLGGSPEEIFLTDRPMLLTILLWLGTASAILLIDR